MVPETGRLVIYAAYRQEVKIADLYTYFDIEVSSPIINLPILNAGVFAARADSPLWREWEKDIKEALVRSGGIFRFGLDQVAFNYAIYGHNLNFSPLPFECDYCTSLTNLVVIDGKICSSAVPFEPAHTIHMTGNNKWIEQLVIVLDQDGIELDTYHDQNRLSLNEKAASMSVSPFDFVEAVSFTKEDIIRDGDAEERDYNAFIVNKALVSFLIRFLIVKK